ncbi:hypothetical protein E2C01_044410 [Portunus trituberculatus]|uniref:Uncharacterized protein n=1 Tax=Portunus trituberculatus TaxID=210409 RepID=A0A5B7FT21_PORTR|nr:hypothetical protein [Portunus trituberculatus]
MKHDKQSAQQKKDAQPPPPPRPAGRIRKLHPDNTCFDNAHKNLNPTCPSAPETRLTTHR